MAWTTEMIEGLKKMWKRGLTTNEIAKELGVSKNSIVGKVHRLNLTSRPSPIKKKDDEDDLDIIETPAEKPVQTDKPKAPVSIEKELPVSQEPEPAKVRVPVETELKKRKCIKLSELDSHTCRWPIGDPKDDHFCFCGNKVRAGQTYCDEHAAIAYVKPAKK